MIEITSGGSTAKTDAFLKAILDGNYYDNLEHYAQRGVDALQSATPYDSGETANSWSYEIERKSDQVAIWWLNTHNESGFNVAIGLQYGHGTGNGGWIEGYDYINPALKPIFDDIANDVWKEVQNA